MEFNGIITIKRGDLLDNVITRRKIMHAFFFTFSRVYIPWSDIGWYGNLNKIDIAHSRKQYIFLISKCFTLHQPSMNLMLRWYNWCWQNKFTQSFMNRLLWLQIENRYQRWIDEWKKTNGFQNHFKLSD